MLGVVIGLIIFCSFLLVVVVLAQNSKGGGLSSQFGGSGTSNMFGVKKTGDFLEKTTWVLVALIMVLSLSTNFIAPSVNTGSSSVLDAASEQAPASTPAATLPAEEKPATDSAK
jgi:preprotein translocase subunit SecG